MTWACADVLIVLGDIATVGVHLFFLYECIHHEVYSSAALLSAFRTLIVVCYAHRMCHLIGLLLLLLSCLALGTASVFIISFQIVILALLPTCLGSCWRLVWFALSYADVITVQEHGGNNSCSPLPFYRYNQPYTSITDCLQPALPA